MKKIFKLIVLVFMSILFIRVNASEKILLEETNKSFGELLTNYEVSDSIYLKNGNSLEKIDIESKNRVTVHEFETDIKDTFMLYSKDIVYFYYTDSENTKVIKYDVLNDSEESVILNTSEVLNENKKLTDLQVDSKGNMYFNYSTNAFVSFDKDGKYIDSYDSGSSDYIMISSISYYDEKLFLYLPLKNSNAYLEIENGKFVNKKLINSKYDIGIVYTNDGLYAVNNHNQIYRLNKEENTLEYVIETPFVTSIAAPIRYNEEYIYLEGSNAYK